MSDALNVNVPPGRHLAAHGAAAEHQPVLADRAGDDADRALGEVVVVEARVVVVHPADEPDLDLVVAAQQLVAALARVVLDQVLPRLRLRHQVGDQGLERAHAATAMRPVNVALACRARTSPAGSSGGPTTGRSEPYTSRSAPTAPAIASTAPRP